ncbi:MAG: hypothetical protein IBJ11_09505 [Phycisphaerales bacterium]|nr:hypothetical protein [Phycisphaerales bacterium]
MAEEAAKTEQAPPKKGLPVKTIVVILAMLAVEAGLIVGVMMMLGKPSEVKAVGPVEGVKEQEGVLREVEIVKEKFSNNRTGKMWVWDTEIIAQVSPKHVEHVEAELEKRRGEIRTGIGGIWRSAEHADLTSPDREVLTRRTLAYLRGIFGQDPEGKEYVQTVLIPQTLGFPTGF